MKIDRQYEPQVEPVELRTLLKGDVYTLHPSCEYVYALTDEGLADGGRYSFALGSGILCRHEPDTPVYRVDATLVVRGVMRAET